MIFRYSVTEVCSAVTCPRIFYFDNANFEKTRAKKPTRIWVGGHKKRTAYGNVFHRTVARFYKSAGKNNRVRRILGEAEKRVPGPERQAFLFRALNRFILKSCVREGEIPDETSKTSKSIKAFKMAVACYVRELAAIVNLLMERKQTAAEVYDDLFGDARRSVDVTFHVGTEKKLVRIAGEVDYVYYDPLKERDRIVDFKLLDVDSTERDVIQVSLYALMHNQQHRTNSHVAVIYLLDGCRIVECTWDEVESNRQVVMDLLESVVAWAAFDEKTNTGLRPFGNPYQCKNCPWRERCEARLGPVSEGTGIGRWARPTRGVTIAEAPAP